MAFDAAVFADEIVDRFAAEDDVAENQTSPTGFPLLVKVAPLPMSSSTAVAPVFVASIVPVLMMSPTQRADLEMQAHLPGALMSSVVDDVAGVGAGGDDVKAGITAEAWMTPLFAMRPVNVFVAM